MEEYLSKYHRAEIEDALKAEKSLITVNFDLTNLKKENEKLFNQIKYSFEEEYAKWKKAALNQITQLIQKANIQLAKHQKLEIDFDFFNHPQKIEWPSISSDLFQLVEFKGYVFRSSTPRKLELLREVMCKKCHKSTMIKANRFYDYAFECSRKCIMKEDCDGKMLYTKKQEEVPPLEYTVDFQVFKVQELDKFTPKNRYYSVEVEGKLVDSCSIGDTVYVLGTFETRNDLKTKETKRIVIRALKISKAFEFKQSINSNEKETAFNGWIAGKKRNNDNELEARDEMLKGVVPELNNCFILKLALLIVLCTGGRSRNCKTRTQRLERMSNRDISHILLIGLPGLGKSQLLKAASKLSYRAIKCVGSACSLHGLTASSYKEDKETHVEAGALVLANHGICCIDEFNLLSTRNRGALHDVMEHQKFSFMQANLKVEINTRCSIIASMNHKLEQTAEARNKSIKNAAFNIEPSLISRFDFVFFLEKPEDPEFDESMIDAIINGSTTAYQEVVTEWNLERLQLHVIVAKNITCELTLDTHRLLFNYYRFCVACEEVDESRKTMRLLKSLERLTVGHAKLMLRNKTKLMDAITIIWLMENSWSFGDLIQQTNVILSELPLGPSPECIQHIFDTLQLSHLKEVFDKEQSEISDDTACPMQLNTTVSEQVQEKREPKKLFNKTGTLKRRSDEQKNTESSTENVDEELPEFLRKSFAINRLEDLFNDSDEETDGNNKEENGLAGSSKVQNASSDKFSVEQMEDYFLNEEIEQLDESLNNFEVPKENMSTQSGKPSASPVDNNTVCKEALNNLQKSTILPQKSDDLSSKENETKRRKKSIDDEDRLLEEILQDLPHSRNLVSKNDKVTQKKSASLGFFGRLKTYEYKSQPSQTTEPKRNDKKTDGSISTAISENLYALSNQLAGNHIENVAEQKVTSTSMTREELSKALDDELDLWN